MSIKALKPLLAYQLPDAKGDYALVSSTIINFTGDNLILETAEQLSSDLPAIRSTLCK